jgi:hypothetical protein
LDAANMRFDSLYGLSIASRRRPGLCAGARSLPRVGPGPQGRSGLATTAPAAAAARKRHDRRAGC